MNKQEIGLNARYLNEMQMQLCFQSFVSISYIPDRTTLQLDGFNVVQRHKNRPVALYHPL